ARRFEVIDAEGKSIALADLPGRRALATGQAEAMLRVRDKATGTERWTDVRSFAIRNSDGAAEFVVNIIRDVTPVMEALRSEEIARRQEAEARRRAEYLSRVTAVLGQSLDY